LYCAKVIIFAKHPCGGYKVVDAYIGNELKILENLVLCMDV